MIKEIDYTNLLSLNILLKKSDFPTIEIEYNNNFLKRKCYIIDDHIVGYIQYALYFERAELEYICVDNSYKRKKVASLLMKHMFNDCKKRGCINITLEVNENNIPAILLYKKFNFEQVAIRKKYYKDADALLMERKLDDK